MLLFVWNGPGVGSAAISGFAKGVRGGGKGASGVPMSPLPNWASGLFCIFIFLKIPPRLL